MLITKVFPTVFALDSKVFNSKLENLKFAPSLHLDFMDGIFTHMKSVNFSEMRDILKYPEITFEVHLMAYEPQKYISEIKNLKIKKVLIHYEVFEKDEEITECIDLFKREKIKVFLVFKPDCDIRKALKFVNLIDGVMLMSVYPGKEGQSFIETTYEKVNLLRKNVPDLNIQVDGGINSENIRKLVRQGANLLSVGSFISSSTIPKDNYEKLVYLVNNN